MTGRTHRLALLGVVCLAFGARALGFERVFVDGEVAFAFGDPFYHLRLAAFSWRHFPDFLVWDPYLNFPNGARVPWPPLYDLLVAGSARLLGASARGLEIVAAWWPPLLGTLTVLAVHATGRAAGGAACGLGAATIFALLPASSVFSGVGYADHHAAVVLWGAALLALQVELVRDAGPRAPFWIGVGLALARAALVLTWSGSLAYLAVSELPVVLVAAARRGRRLLYLEAASLIATAALVAPFSAAASAGIGGSFSAIVLSWLQPTACTALAIWAWVSAGVIGRAPSLSSAGRVIRCVLAGGGVALGLVAVPGVWEELAQGRGFLASSEAWGIWGDVNPEQAPLLRGGSQSWGVYLMGYLGFLVPLAPLAPAVRAWRPGRRGPLLLVTVWSAAFGALALAQARFANDLAPSASVAFALLLGGTARPVADRLRLAGRARALPAVALAALLLAPALARHQVPALVGSLRASSGPAEARRSPQASIVRFARTVGEVTPETSGFLEPEAEPEYGILSDPSLGHALHYFARRATPSDNFGPHIGADGFREAVRLLLGEVDDATVPSLRAHRLRYVITNWQPAWRTGSLLQRLHERDARSVGRLPALEHFRLVAEGPEDGLPLAAMFSPVPGSGVVPYKLFEVVEGARLRVSASPGSPVTASVTVVGSRGRRFVHRVRGVADATGVATLRVPYPTHSQAPVHTADPYYRVRAEGSTRWVEVSELDVRAGHTLEVSATP